MKYAPKVAIPIKVAHRSTEIIIPINAERIIKLRPTTVMNVASTPFVISGRNKYCPDKICSMAFACTSTPGRNGLRGVFRKSFSPSALAPIKTILSFIKFGLFFSNHNKLKLKKNKNFIWYLNSDD